MSIKNDVADYPELSSLRSIELPEEHWWRVGYGEGLKKALEVLDGCGRFGQDKVENAIKKEMEELENVKSTQKIR